MSLNISKLYMSCPVWPAGHYVFGLSVCHTLWVPLCVQSLENTVLIQGILSWDEWHLFRDTSSWDDTSSVTPLPWGDTSSVRWHLCTLNLSSRDTLYSIFSNIPRAFKRKGAFLGKFKQFNCTSLISPQGPIFEPLCPQGPIFEPLCPQGPIFEPLCPQGPIFEPLCPEGPIFKPLCHQGPIFEPLCPQGPIF